MENKPLGNNIIKRTKQKKQQKEISLGGIPKDTTLKVSRELRDKLAEIANKDETFGDVIRRLIRRAEPERSGEIVTSKTSAIQYKRKKEFVELYAYILDKDIKNLGIKPKYITPSALMGPQLIGVEYEYNIPPKKEGEWGFDIKILKVYYEQRTYNPSEFFGVDDEHKYLSEEFIRIYFNILADILVKDWGITKLRYLRNDQSILDWRKVYYENKLSEESFINDVEDVLRDFSNRNIDSKIQKQLENSVVGH